MVLSLMYFSRSLMILRKIKTEKFQFSKTFTCTRTHTFIISDNSVSQGERRTFQIFCVSVSHVHIEFGTVFKFNRDMSSHVKFYVNINCDIYKGSTK
jgi:hypothetical protein